MKPPSKLSSASHGAEEQAENQKNIHDSHKPRLPKRLLKEGRPYLPKKHRRGIKLDTIKASDLRLLELRFFCDDCSHYDASRGKCTIGYRAQHTRAEQMALYELSGKMAFCRMIEID